MSVIAIDQGTTSTRSLKLDDSGKYCITHSITHEQHYPQPGWVEHDPEELNQNIQACIKASGKIDAIGIDNQGESCLAWDAETKEALTPIIVWQDKRTSDVIGKLKQQGFEETTLAKAGLPLDPYFSAGKLGWIIENSPAAKEAHSKCRLRLGTTDAFFLNRLTGKCVTDITTASRTSLMNLHTHQWDEELCALFGVPMDCLPDIVPTTGDFGTIHTDHGPVPVTASIVDQQAALYGFGCRKEGDGKITFGTGAFALMVTGSELHHRPDLGLLPTIAWQKHGEAPVYALDGGIYTASAALNWAKGLGLFEKFEAVNQFTSSAAIDQGLVFVPALSGLGCPHWDDKARGSWMGLSLDHEPQQLVQAILEGIAFRATEVWNAMQQCVASSSPVPVDGGMSQNPYFVQFLSDCLGRTVQPANIPELTAIGTALLAAEGVGHPIAFTPEFGKHVPMVDRSAGYLKFQKAVGMSRNWS